MVFRFFHQVLPRDAADQSQLGEPVGFIQEAKCGDLAFFDDEQGNIIHVGIMANSGEIWHASGSVRLDPIDHVGIMHKVSGERTHRLRIIKRIVPISFVEFDV
jgi:cell wall-associated NlpC family hydrolase